MKREQIIKALECCSSGNSVSACMGGCPLYEKEDCECINDDTALLKYALSLIKELTEERDKEHELGFALYCKVADLTEENERLRADTVRKMHDMIKTRCIEGGIYPAFVARIVDEVAKELIGDDF